MRHAWLWLGLCAATSAHAADERWMAVARGADSPEVRELALALATEGADPAVERAAARLIRSLRQDLPAELAEVDAMTVELRVDRAREAWRIGQTERAMRLLEPVRDDPLAAVLYDEAVDAWVGAERERLGALYVEAKQGPRGGRSARLHEVRRGLAGLIEDYPDSAYADALASNLERVERELELLW